MSRAEPISWPTARRMVRKVSGNEPFSNSYLASTIDADFHECTERAEEFIFEATGLVADGPARIRVVDRDAWADANIQTFRRLMRPLTEKLQAKGTSKAAFLGPHVTGTQLGLILGWMSTRVLGQYDLLLEPEENPESQDLLYYVAPNVIALEKRFAFPPKEFRLWIALHECTHRAQFTGVPWMPAYFKSMVHELLADVDTDSSQITDGIKKLLNDKSSSGNDAGLMSAFATPRQREVIGRITGLMALLEGHADVTMSRAAGSFIPSAERFHRVMHMRRTNAAGITKVFQRLLGMEAKLRQYVEGEKFVNAVEAAGGRALFDQVWQRAENLPTAEEIRSPQLWIDRMGNVVEPA